MLSFFFYSGGKVWGQTEGSYNVQQSQILTQTEPKMPTSNTYNLVQHSALCFNLRSLVAIGGTFFLTCPTDRLVEPTNHSLSVTRPNSNWSVLLKASRKTLVSFFQPFVSGSAVCVYTSTVTLKAALPVLSLKSKCNLIYLPFELGVGWGGWILLLAV